MSETSQLSSIAGLKRSTRVEQVSNHTRIGVWIALLADLIVGICLLYSGITHLGNPYFFLEAVANYRILGVETSVVTAALLSNAVTMLGIFLIMGQFKHAVRILAGCVFTLFFFAQLWALLTGLNIACGCFGNESEAVGFVSLARLIVLLALLGTAAYFSSVSREN